VGVVLVKSSCVDYLHRSKVRLATCQDTTTLLLYKSQLFLLCFCRVSVALAPSPSLSLAFSLFFEQKKM
jgi:hypothetical protein